MINPILIGLSLAMQLVAAVYCITAGRKSRYGLAWYLGGCLSVLMLGARVALTLHFMGDKSHEDDLAISSIVMLIISAGFLGGVVFIGRLEKRLNEQSAALRGSKAQLDTLLNNAPDYIFTIRLDGTITYFNRAEKPYETHDVVGSNWFSWLNEESKAAGRAAIDTAVASRQSNIVVVQLTPAEFAGLFFECHVSPIASGNGVDSVMIIARDITDLHKKDEAVSVSEERYRKLVELSRDAILVHCDSRIVFANSATAELFGAGEVSEILGKSPYDFVHPDFASAVRERVKSAVVDKQDVPVVRIRSLRLDGTTRELLSTAHPYVWEGKPAIQVILKDITELVKTREALAESESLFKNLFDEMHVACAMHEVIVDSGGNAVDFTTLETNPAFERVMGLSRERVVGRRISEALPTASKEWIRALGTPAVTGIPVHFERYSPLLEKYLEVTSFRYAPGKFGTVIADVTERRKAEDALRESEERFRQIAENMREGCWLLDLATFKLIYMNSAHGEIYDRPAEEFHKAFMTWMNYVHPDDIARVKSVVEKNAGVFNPVDMDFRIVRPDGSVRFVYSRAFPILDASGKPYRLAGILEDITLLKEAETKLQEHAEQLERKVVERSAQLVQSERLANLGRLVAGVAHEINNPVQTIASHLQAIEDNDSLPQSVAERLKSVQVGLNRISSVTQQLRHLYRENPRDLLAIDVRKVVSDVLSLYSSQLREQGISLHIKLPDEPSLGLCNEGAIHESLGNLLVNAMDAMPEGGTLDVRLEANDAAIHIIVVDSGHGISSPVIDRIFEPFFTTKPVGSGTGLGLAISRESLEAVGCSITAASDGPGRGATFTISIPILPS